MVKTFCDQLLARPSFANDEHWPIERRGTAGALDRVEKSQALADELVCALHNSLEQKSDRLLVANPTIWQGFSCLTDTPDDEFLESRGFPEMWHASCIAMNRFR